MRKLFNFFKTILCYIFNIKSKPVVKTRVSKYRKTDKYYLPYYIIDFYDVREENCYEIILHKDNKDDDIMDFYTRIWMTINELSVYLLSSNISLKVELRNRGNDILLAHDKILLPDDYGYEDYFKEAKKQSQLLEQWFEGEIDEFYSNIRVTIYYQVDSNNKIIKVPNPNLTG